MGGEGKERMPVCKNHIPQGDRDGETGKEEEGQVGPQWAGKTEPGQGRLRTFTVAPCHLAPCRGSDVVSPSRVHVLEAWSSAC